MTKKEEIRNAKQHGVCLGAIRNRQDSEWFDSRIGFMTRDEIAELQNCGHDDFVRMLKSAG